MASLFHTLCTSVSTMHDVTLTLRSDGLSWCSNPVLVSHSLTLQELWWLMNTLSKHHADPMGLMHSWRVDMMHACIPDELLTRAASMHHGYECNRHDATCGPYRVNAVMTVMTPRVAVMTALMHRPQGSNQAECRVYRNMMHCPACPSPGCPSLHVVFRSQAVINVIRS